MIRLVDLRFPVGVTATASQEHSSVVEADIVDQRKLIVGHRLLKGPEKIVGRCHQQGAVLHWVPLIAAKGWFRILLGDAVKSLNERFDF